MVIRLSSFNIIYTFKLYCGFLQIRYSEHDDLVSAVLAHVAKAYSSLNPDANILAAEANKEKQINAFAIVIHKVCALIWKNPKAFI